MFLQKNAVMAMLSNSEEYSFSAEIVLDLSKSHFQFTSCILLPIAMMSSFFLSKYGQLEWINLHYCVVCIQRERVRQT